MIVESLERQQKQDLLEFRALKQKDPKRAAEEALRRLTAAKIVDENGKLAKPYREAI